MGRSVVSKLAVPRILAAAWFIFLAAASLRLTLAQLMFRDNPSSVLWPLAVDPAEYERLAESDREQAPALLLRAVTVNPRFSSAWIALGLAAERCGDYAEAERDLLEAAQVDRQYLPSWSLANFYFRRANGPAFWPWARRAAELSYTDLAPLLQLCDRMEPANVLARLGDSARVERAYLDLLIRENRLEDAQNVARRILARRAPEDRPLLAAFTSRQIEAGNGDAALEIWQRLFLSETILSNGDLKTAPSGEGFDWRLPPADGVTVQWRDSRVSFFLSGKQPEASVLLEQVVALEAGRYRLRFEYSTPGTPLATGIRWAIASKASSVRALPVNEGSALASSEAGRDEEWTFEVPHKILAWLELVYRREPGAARSQGRLEIRNLRMERL